MNNDLIGVINAQFGQGFYELVNDKLTNYRQTQDLAVFDVFKFEVVKNDEGERFDKNFYQRQILTLLLSMNYSASDKPLIRWLIAEFCKNTNEPYDFWVDLRSVMVLLGFMLYRYMENSDLPILYQTKFGACSDSCYSVDIEIVLGFGMEQTLDCLKKHKKENAIYKEIISVINEYKKQSIQPRAYDEYCEFFINHRFKMRQNEIAYDCGLSDDDNELF